MPTAIKGQPPSTEIRKELKELGLPVILQFSGGKDSIATWIALEEDGIEVVPVFLHVIPGLQFVSDELDYFAEKFDAAIYELIHPGLYRQIGKHAVAQPPERLGTIAGWDYPDVTYDEFWGWVRDSLGLPGECYCADGIRAADSMQRRVHFVSHGVINTQRRKVSPIADWLKADVMGAIERKGVKLPVDYELFGRSFDGFDYRFLKPIKDKFPDDYGRILEVFPLAEADIFRHECLGVHNA